MLRYKYNYNAATITAMTTTSTIFNISFFYDSDIDESYCIFSCCSLIGCIGSTSGFLGTSNRFRLHTSFLFYAFLLTDSIENPQLKQTLHHHPIAYHTLDKTFSFLLSSLYLFFYCKLRFSFASTNQSSCQPTAIPVSVESHCIAI